MFEGVGTIVRFSDDDIVFHEEEEATHMYVVLEGHVKLTRARVWEAGEAVSTLAVLGPGEFFGEMALFDYGPRSATASAVGHVVLKMITRKEFADGQRRDPEVALQFLDKMSRRMRQADDLLDELTVRTKLAENLYSRIEAVHYWDFLTEPTVH